MNMKYKKHEGNSDVKTHQNQIIDKKSDSSQRNGKTYILSYKYNWTEEF